jgi:F0F1-type ATP synthase membrane subunit a
MTNLKDKLTNVLAFVVVIATSADTYLKASAGEDINWFNLGMAVVVAVVSYMTGKKADGTKKVI